MGMTAKKSLFALTPTEHSAVMRDSPVTSAPTAAEQPSKPTRSRKNKTPMSGDTIRTVAIRLTKDEYVQVHDFCHQAFLNTGELLSMATVGKEALLKYVNRKGARNV